MLELSLFIFQLKTELRTNKAEAAGSLLSGKNRHRYSEQLRPLIKLSAALLLVECEGQVDVQVVQARPGRQQNPVLAHVQTHRLCLYLPKNNQLSSQLRQLLCRTTNLRFWAVQSRPLRTEQLLRPALSLSGTWGTPTFSNCKSSVNPTGG